MLTPSPDVRVDSVDNRTTHSMPPFHKLATFRPIRPLKGATAYPTLPIPKIPCSELPLFVRSNYRIPTYGVIGYLETRMSPPSIDELRKESRETKAYWNQWPMLLLKDGVYFADGS